MGICYIVAAGDMYGTLPMTTDDDMIIAADAGLLHLEKSGIEPDVLLGDFDSMDLPEDREAIVYPVRKDDTDTILAVKLGLQKGYTEFVIYGGLGGKRTDHTVANIQTLAYIAQNGGRGTLVGNGECFTLIRDSELVIESGEGKNFSVFAYAGKAEGVTIEGSHYDVKNAELTPFFPLGVSNKSKEKAVKIKVKKGCLLIVCNK
ncbi:MAG: thiamine diphosphokinase [Clostridia bacterium]|nr:thiamine diphosphokinase [Clostridia bacterium]